jgi:hypothetical protein
VRRQIGVSQAPSDRGIRQMRLGLVDTAHHRTDAVQGRFDRGWGVHVDVPGARASAKAGRVPTCLLQISASHDDAGGIVEDQVGGDAAPDDTIPTDDQHAAC